MGSGFLGAFGPTTKDGKSYMYTRESTEKIRPKPLRPPPRLRPFVYGRNELPKTTYHQPDYQIDHRLYGSVYPNTDLIPVSTSARCRRLTCGFQGRRLTVFFLTAIQHDTPQIVRIIFRDPPEPGSCTRPPHIGLGRHIINGS